MASRTPNQSWSKGLDAGTAEHQTASVALFSKKNQIIRIFCITGRFAVPINPDKWSYTVGYLTKILTPQLVLKTILNFRHRASSI